MSQLHKYQDLISLFNQAFGDTENTLLMKGQDEPIYIPAETSHGKHRIIFAHGYFASALHEIAHWCIAGKERRLLEDYGYWYCPDGRSEAEQAEFEKVEVKPQAIEWAFCCAANKPFQVSTDNLNGAPVDRKAFQIAVREQALVYLRNGFPARAGCFIQVLRDFYQTSELSVASFDLTEKRESITNV
ncbi:elongation factor P hydroxylase [Paraglaciecola aquimarina]|uniref:Elongation factor P hydroxylase n=1 Tax=Paraglaciecola aquimarina TaxID=1235557 RepID=A0ABU3T0V0_9ALTE|nr:elongation factor P hydroxylase [Paraglaciecola aquimarina]MDU0355881.1 elongation factor P hydroxylase [Paraglaciecola aquimarina]